MRGFCFLARSSARRFCSSSARGTASALVFALALSSSRSLSVSWRSPGLPRSRSISPALIGDDLEQLFDLDLLGVRGAGVKLRRWEQYLWA